MRHPPSSLEHPIEIEGKWIVLLLKRKWFSLPQGEGDRGRGMTHYEKCGRTALPRALAIAALSSPIASIERLRIPRS